MSDKYKINYRSQDVHRVMIAYSGGVTSVACLDMLADLLEEQYNAHNGKQGFQLVVVHIDNNDSEVLDKSIKDTIASRIDNLPFKVENQIIPVESFLDSKQIRRLNMDKQFNILLDKNESNQTRYSLDDVLDLIPNKTSKEDFLQVVYEDIINSAAVESGCGTILYCNHLSNLASKVLAMIVKGRGTNIMDKIQDNTIKVGDEEISVINPLRDLYLQEIQFYLEINSLDDKIVTSKIPVSNISKNMTVEQITSRYLKQVEEAGYSSIPSTVVKTGEKLTEPSMFPHTTDCRICHNKIYQKPKNWLTRITVNDEEPLTTQDEKDYAEEYQEYLSSIKQVDSKFDISNINICYGCMVSIHGIKPDTGFLWPNDQEVLDEFIIDSDEE